MTDEQLWDAFQDRTLSSTKWTHEAHLRVAYMFLKRHSLDDAHILMRGGIIRLNQAHALVETPTRGYHETITRAFLCLLVAEADNFVEDSYTFVSTRDHFFSKEMLLEYYSRDLINSQIARAIFVPPDKRAFPTVRLPVIGKSILTIPVMEKAVHAAFCSVFYMGKVCLSQRL